jgi:hypothetical protein
MFHDHSFVVVHMREESEEATTVCLFVSLEFTYTGMEEPGSVTIFAKTSRDEHKLQSPTDWHNERKQLSTSSPHH